MTSGTIVWNDYGNDIEAREEVSWIVAKQREVYPWPLEDLLTTDDVDLQVYLFSCMQHVATIKPYCTFFEPI